MRGVGGMLRINIIKIIKMMNSILLADSVHGICERITGIGKEVLFPFL